MSDDDEIILIHRATRVKAQKPNSEHPNSWRVTMEDGDTWLVEDKNLAKLYADPKTYGWERTK